MSDDTQTIIVVKDDGSEMEVDLPLT